MAETQPQGCTPQLRLMRALAAAGCWSGVRADGCSSANSRVLQGCELCETGRRGEPIWFAFEINPKCFCFLKNTVLLNRCGMILNQGWGKKKQNNTSGFLKPTELLLALGSGHHSVRPPDPEPQAAPPGSVPCTCLSPGCSALCLGDVANTDAPVPKLRVLFRAQKLLRAQKAHAS